MAATRIWLPASILSSNNGLLAVAELPPALECHADPEELNVDRSG
jgi:hypothetical protein